MTTAKLTVIRFIFGETACITGGESGPNHRPLNMDNVRSMRDQCARNGIAFHHKQNGGFRGKANGCLVDGVEHKHFPPALAA